MEKELIKLKEIFSKGKGLTLNELITNMGWTKLSKSKVNGKIDELLNDGDLMRSKSGKYNLPTNLGFEKGILSIIKDRFGFVDTESEGIFVPRSKFNGALNGDTVLIEIDKNCKNDKKKEGEIIKILKREKDTVIGIYEKRKNFGFVVPTHSFGSDIYISNANTMGAKDGELVVVKITFWGDKERNPEGKIDKILGEPYNTNNMIEALIVREGLSTTFPADVIKEAKEISTVVSGKDLEGRKDLRDLPIITIDGADAKDLDDAVFVEKLQNGNYRLIVSIADVSHYVPEGSALDKEAYHRGNSVYLVDRVIPMFPKELSNGICSLNPREDKLTFTCEAEITPQGKVVSHDIYKSVIKTAHRMTYDGVNKIIAKDPEVLEKYADIVDMVGVMLELSHIIRKQKYDRGSIDFDIPEIKLILDENGNVKYIDTRERGESERIIEDFMITANEVVAERLFWAEIPTVYRTHEKPDPERIKTLNESLAKFKYKLHNLDHIYPKQFQEIVEDSKERGINLLVHKMILMSLKQAKYTTTNVGHFGLASTYYTHFTSPIRRYSDLMVHRILSSILTGVPNKKVLAKNEENFPKMCEHISKTERAAMKVEEESTKIKLVEYMMDKVGNDYDASIIGFSNKRVFFETNEYIECFWDVTACSHYYEFDEVDYVMKDRDTGEILNIGDKFKVTLIKASLRDLELEVVPDFVMDNNLMTR